MGQKMIKPNDIQSSNTSETESPVLDWDKIVHKNVRTNDNQAVGSIVAVGSDSIVITSQGARHEYSVPKSSVESYNGAEVFLNFPAGHLERFKV
jgi:hypothetical protein